MTTRRFTNPSKRRTGGQVIPHGRLRMHCRPCDKWGYVDKAHARDERKELRRDSKVRGDNRPLDIYPCPENPAQWHIGHNYERAEEIRLQYLKHGVS